MLQKLSIIRALLHDPDILFLDEPISGLDPIGIKQIRDLIISENREGRTIFISSHLLSEMEKLCHRVAIIHKGKLLAEDQMDFLLARFIKDKEIIIDLETLPPNISDDIKKLSFIIDTTIRDNTLIIKVSKERDFRKDISSYLIKKGPVFSGRSVLIPLLPLAGLPISVRSSKRQEAVRLAKSLTMMGPVRWRRWT